MLQIYAVNNNLDSLLLVDGSMVINGAYRLKVRDGVATIAERPEIKYKAYLLGSLSDLGIKSQGDYNEILEEAKVILKGKKDQIKCGVYQHYKGKRYFVHNVTKHSETLEDLVYYQCLYENPEGQFWVRPLSMFIETVTVDGQTIPRFRLVE